MTKTFAAVLAARSRSSLPSAIDISEPPPVPAMVFSADSNSMMGEDAATAPAACDPTPHDTNSVSVSVSRL